MAFSLNAAVALLLVVPQWTFETDRIGSVPTGWEARGGSPDGIYDRG
jgi:hypothetical protein